jgi:hypothetical protein
MKMPFAKPSAYTTILNRLCIIEEDPSLGEGRWTRDEERTNELFKFFKLNGRKVPAEAIDAVFAMAKSDKTFGTGGLNTQEELANQFTKLWNAATPPVRAEALPSLKTIDIKAREVKPA